eukprot:8998056-Pyramimonas_sp.AAC.2
MVVVLRAEVQDDSQLQELKGVDAVCGRVVLLQFGQLVSSCIAVVLDEFPELGALRDVLGLVDNTMVNLKLRSFFFASPACKVGGYGEELPHQCKECSASITVVGYGVIVVGLGVRGDEVVRDRFTVDGGDVLERRSDHVGELVNELFVVRHASSAVSTKLPVQLDPRNADGVGCGGVGVGDDSGRVDHAVVGLLDGRDELFRLRIRLRCFFGLRISSGTYWLAGVWFNRKCSRYHVNKVQGLIHVDRHESDWTVISLTGELCTDWATGAPLHPRLAKP